MVLIAFFRVIISFFLPIIQPRTMRRSSVSIKRFSHCFLQKNVQAAVRH
nr:MAG TPA: hypothetical protein [Caudoviricetes sp.]